MCCNNITSAKTKKRKNKYNQICNKKTSWLYFKELPKHLNQGPRVNAGLVLQTQGIDQVLLVKISLSSGLVKGVNASLGADFGAWTADGQGSARATVTSKPVGGCQYWVSVWHRIILLENIKFFPKIQ
jgi:hypothetical protein